MIRWPFALARSKRPSSGYYIRRIFDPEYVEVLEARLELTNVLALVVLQIPIASSHQFKSTIRHRPSNWRARRPTSIKTPRMIDCYLGGFQCLPQAKHQSWPLHLPHLGCAVPLQPGSILLFSGVEFYRGCPIIQNENLEAALDVPGGYEEETYFQVICYLKLGILSGTSERSMPTTRHGHPDRRDPTRQDLIRRSRNTSGTHVMTSEHDARWTNIL